MRMTPESGRRRTSADPTGARGYSKCCKPLDKGRVQAPVAGASNANPRHELRSYGPGLQPWLAPTLYNRDRKFAMHPDLVPCY